MNLFLGIQFEIHPKPFMEDVVQEAQAHCRALQVRGGHSDSRAGLWSLQGVRLFEL
jgi:hypothetical protein